MSHVHFRWLKDFIAVAELGSFSRAADDRAITQPAMSRHIKGLEEWVGVTLVDRSNFPARLTPAGEAFLRLARENVEQLENGVLELQQLYRVDSQLIRFSMQHALAAEFFTQWWSSLKIDDIKRAVTVKVDALNLHDCTQRLESGHSQFLICYQYPDGKALLDTEEYAHTRIGQDSIVPVSCTDKNGRPLFSLNDSRKSFPMVGSAPDEFMGRIVAGIIHRNQAEKRFRCVYEDSFSAGVKAQALAGFGIAWLPSILVKEEIQQGRLKVVGDSQWQVDLDIMLQRRVEPQYKLVDAIWQAVK